VFLQGDPADWVFLLCRGKVRVFLTDPSGRERTLRIILPGEPFGEAAAFLDSGYPASSAALEPSLALRFGTSSLAGLVRENPNLALAAIGVLASRLKEMTALLGSGLKEVEPRLAAFLLELPSEAGRVWLPAKKAELARHLGTTPESLSRALGRLKAQGLVREDERYHISILDRDRLEGIALG
jgi:CRP/FNR family transcriptional regulator